MEGFAKPPQARDGVAEAIFKAREIGVEFLHTELLMAGCFLEIAEATENPLTMRRNLEHTRRALEVVDQFMDELKPKPHHREELLGICARLRSRLSQMS